jgi:hypothetical protein
LVNVLFLRLFLALLFLCPAVLHDGNGGVWG